MKGETAVCTWSGGIDSTAVIAQLLSRGWHVRAVTLEFYGPEFCAREGRARWALTPIFRRLAEDGGGSFSHETRRADWIWNFSRDGKEIPRRNKLIMEHLIVIDLPRHGTQNLGMGEYVGCDTWVVRDHVGASDCDHRALSAWLYGEFGLGYRLLSLQDFGESRFKHHRLALGREIIGDAMALTTNCLEESAEHCGRCYKCIERAVAFSVLGAPDPTPYGTPPRGEERWPAYVHQMGGGGR